VPVGTSRGVDESSDGGVGHGVGGASDHLDDVDAAARGPAGRVDFVAVPSHHRSGIFAEDGVHPNEDGYLLWADHIAACLVQLLRLDDKKVPTAHELSLRP